MPAQAFHLAPPEERYGVATAVPLAKLKLLPSLLRPDCPADQRLFCWKGVNIPPQTMLDIPLLHALANMAIHHSWRDAGSYGSGLRKYHLFCDIFSVPESDRLPASFAVLNSFALWAAADPEPTDIELAGDVPFEPVAVNTVHKYLAAVRAWHIAQGWPPPISDDERDVISTALRGLENKQGHKRTRPPRPPITIRMLAALKSALDLTDPFDACIWAIAACAFWGMMRLGEATVRSRAKFSPLLHLTRGHSFFGVDLKGKHYARLDLPAAKTARAGEVQSVFLTTQGLLCGIEALRNLGRVVPAEASHPLFSWRDSKGEIRPMVRDRAMERINGILMDKGFGTMFGHSFRIGGASFYLAEKVSPEIVRIAGRWRSLAYEAYIRAFEQISSQHMADLAVEYELQFEMVG